jgi:hypothetical protein
MITLIETGKTILPMLILLCLPLFAKAEDALETKVKSAYVYHLINYIEWEKLPDDGFHVCVLGADSMEAMLRELINRQVKNLPLKINAEDIENPALCQVLFIGRSVANWREIIVKLKNSNVLTVSDCEHFAQGGGMVGFYSQEGKTKLELNPSVMHAANLNISAKLMEVARIVPPQ